MPRRAANLLRWSPEEQSYMITSGSSSLEVIPGSCAWLEWLDSIPSFAFQSRLGDHCTLRKERLRRGDHYWYGYRSVHGRTVKRYIGKTADLSLGRLEEISAHFIEVSQSSPSQAHIQAPRERDISAARMPLLKTKLHPPRLPALLVERSRLMDLLDSRPGHKLTLLLAPAGFGKTTLANQWLVHRRTRASQQHAWVSLDAGDNDPVRFWSYLITAFQTYHNDIGQTALEQLSQAPQIPFSQSPLETVLTLFLNDITQHVQDGIFILEDYHLIEHPRIHETLAFFIEHLPASLHLLILTRSEPPLPLMRWRARGELLEIQSSQIRFSAEETALFLEQLLPSTLSQEMIHELHSRLEGWAVGLRLLALSVHGLTTPQAIEDSLRQHGASSRPHRPILEYFVSEVLNTQPEPLQLFLLQTSVLSRLTGSLCDALTGRQDSTKWLEQAERSGFFLEALDNKGDWYRYHPLFNEAMRVEATRRLGDEELRRLSQKASQWYEEHGMQVEAIESALSAQEHERAAQLIERLNEATYFSELYTMRRWLEQLPESLLRAHPILCFRFAQVAQGVDSDQVEKLLQMAEEEWIRLGDRSSIGTLYAFRATNALIEGLIDSAVAYSHQAFEFLPLESAQGGGQTGKWIDWRSGCLIALGMEAYQEGFFEKAHQFTLEAYTISLNAGYPVFIRTSRLMLGDINISTGKLHEAASYYQQTLAEPALAMGDVYIRAGVTAGLAKLSYQWNKLKQMEQEIDQLEQLKHDASTYRGYYWEEESRVERNLLRSQLLYARGDGTLAQQQLKDLLVHLQISASLYTQTLIPDVLSWQARFQIRDNDLTAAARTLKAFADYNQGLSSLQHETQRLLHARLLLARGEVDAALPLLEQLLFQTQQKEYITRALEIQILIALTYAVSKQGQQARQQLSEVLSQARHGGFMRLFLDEGEPLAVLLRSLLPSLTEKSLRGYARSILHAFVKPSHATSLSKTESALIEPLSTQEQRVLRLLVAGRSNPEIAEALIISINTVKGHVKNLYRKLNATNRVEAGEMARHLELL